MWQELYFIRSSKEKHTVISIDDSEEPRVDITRLTCCVSHGVSRLQEQLRINKNISKGLALPIKFRSWELVKILSSQEIKEHTWSVKTLSKAETSRHVLVAFQKNQYDVLKADMSRFDQYTLGSIRDFLNTERYPYDEVIIIWKTMKPF